MEGWARIVSVMRSKVLKLTMMGNAFSGARHAPWAPGLPRSQKYDTGQHWKSWYNIVPIPDAVEKATVAMQMCRMSGGGRSEQKKMQRAILTVQVDVKTNNCPMYHHFLSCQQWPANCKGKVLTFPASAMFSGFVMKMAIMCLPMP